MCPLCYHKGGSLLHCLSTLTIYMAVYFCCTGLGVTSTGRYPASCPVKPGLSSPIPFRLNGRDHLFHSPLFSYLEQSCFYELYRETAASRKLTYNRIVGKMVCSNSQKIFQKLQQTLCLMILRLILTDLI